MSLPAESRESDAAVQTTPLAENIGQVGVVTRAVSWVIDWLVINVVAIMAGVGAALVLAIFPLANHLKPAFEIIAGSVYIIWAAAYFVAFWSLTGQTLGARVMQIRLMTAKRTRVKPGRALVRWVGMNLAMLFFCAGYVPILFGRRGFPDWLAKTLVLDEPQMSLVGVRRSSLQTKRGGSRKRPPLTSPELGPSSPAVADGRGDPIVLPSDKTVEATHEQHPSSPA